MAFNPLSAIPALDSLPGAPAALYLDFDGHYQSTWGEYSNIDTPAYDSDGDATTFSDAERRIIEDVWRMVAEDYAPFNINVTTVEPAVLAAGVPESEANGKALRVSIGGTGDWSPFSGGHAYRDAFTNYIPNVAFAFAQGDSNPIAIAVTASHEAGHGFGLAHYSGALDHDADWQAIMSGFSMGYDNATWYSAVNDEGTFQDDIAVLARAENGFGLRADDHGGTFATATALSADADGYIGSGIVGPDGDVDMFRIDADEAAGFEVRVEGIEIGQNLDVVVDLFDGSGDLLLSIDPTDSRDAFLISEFEGTRHIAVRSNGQYGRIGQFTLSVAPTPAAVNVTRSSAVMTTSESGRGETVTLVLNSKPTADVTFDLASSGLSEVVLSQSQIVFTPENWYLPQSVTISGVDDGVLDGDQGVTVAIAPAVSGDAAYHAMDPDDVPVTNLGFTPGRLVYLEQGSGLGFVKLSDRSTHEVQTAVDLQATFGGESSSFAPNSIAIDQVNGKMYWTDTGSDAIRRSNLDGSSPETIVSGLPSPTGLAVDPAGGKLYWMDYSTDKLQRSDLDGSNIEDVIVSGLQMPDDLWIDPAGGKIYWVDRGDYMIRRANLDGSGIETVVAGNFDFRPQTLELDPDTGRLYFGARDYSNDTTGPAPKLYRVDLGGGSPELVLDMNSYGEFTSENHYMRDLAIDHDFGRIYWSIGKEMYSAGLNGEHVAHIVDGADGGYINGVAFIAARPGVTVTPTGGLETSEAGGSTAFTVVLDSPPSANVTIPVASSDASEGAASVSSLTFTPANWNVPQTVLVNGVDDTAVDGDVAYAVVVGAAVSSDARYNSLNPSDVSLINLDDDRPQTKFFVVNDGSQDRTYEYTEDGEAVENYRIDSGNSQPRGAAASVDGSTVWVADGNRRVYVYDADGGLRGSWAAGSLSSRAQVEGVATDGDDVWIVDNRSDRVYRYNNAAGRTSGSQSAVSSFALTRSNRNPKGIVTDGTYIWVLQDNSSGDRIFKYTVGGSLVGNWQIDSASRSPTGLTIDPTGASQHIWVVDSYRDRVYQYDNARSRTGGSQTASANFALAAGNTNPQGIADPPVGTRSEAVVPASSSFEAAFASYAAEEEREKDRRKARDAAFSQWAVDDFTRRTRRG